MNDVPPYLNTMSGDRGTPTPPPHKRDARKRQLVRTALMDRALESLPLFRLSDSNDTSPVSCSTPSGGRWTVHPAPGDRIPGTFDQDVYVEIMRRYHDAGSPSSGAITFTLHSFLRSLGRKADGRSYGLLRSALARLERTLLHSAGAYHDAVAGAPVHAHFTVLSSVSIERRRAEDHDQIPLFSAYSSSEPGEARVVLSPQLRANLHAGHTVTVDIPVYLSLQSPVARRLYRLVQEARARGERAPLSAWGVQVQELARMLPLTQKYPSHLLRVLVPAHEMLITAGVLREAVVVQLEEGWSVNYTFTPDSRDQPFSPHGGKDLA